MKNKKSGFSLLELLVVVSIIGILIALGTVAFSTAQKKSRDSRRRSDVKAMQEAFEQYKAQIGSYGDCDVMADYDDGAGSIMPGGLPQDPKNSGSFVYNTDTACATDAYCVCALMESSSGNADAPTASACNFLSSGNYYCMTNLQ
jgi:prepilin-type N-terminal cleavage/methylation domain-containing protein